MRVRDAALLAAGLAVFALLCWWFGLGGVGEAITSVRPAYLVVYLAVATLVYVAYGTRWFLISRVLGSDSRLGELVLARIAGDGLGSLLPGARVAGDPIRVALVSAAGTPTPLATAAVAADRVLELLGNMLCAITYVTAFALTRGDSGRQTAGIIVVVMAALLLSLLVPMLMLRRGRRPLAFLSARSGRWAALVRETEDHLMRFFQSHPRVFVSGLVVTLAAEALIIAQYYLLLAAFGVHVDVAMLLMATVMTGFARAVPTPAGLGAMEGGQVTLFALTAGQPAVGFVVAMILRMHETLWIALGMTILMIRGFSLSRFARTRQQAPA
jgi:uncharacterized protein (TIRG00374 family)